MTRFSQQNFPQPRVTQRVSQLFFFRKSCRWLLWGLFALAVVHRLAWLATVPPPQATNDEYFYLWSGMSMIEGEAPIAWTMLHKPETPILGIFKWKSAEYTIMRPAFDQPPVFSLLTGLSATAAGATAMVANLERPASVTTLWDVPLGRLRMQSVLLFAASFWLMWGWLRLAIGPVAALVSLVMFSCIDVLVIHHRLVVPDTLTTPLTLGTFYVLERWRRGWMPHSRAAGIITVAVGLAGGAKIVALATVPAAFAWSATLFRGRRALFPCLWTCAGAVLALLIVFSFAITYGLLQFVDTMQAQAARFADLGGLFDLIRRQLMIQQDYVNSWLLSGWLLAFMGIASARGPQRAVYAALIGYVIGYTFFAQADVFG